jgi:lipoyl(octanoyl) transferase
MMEYQYLGRIEYGSAFDLQQKIAEELRSGARAQSVLLLLEHPAVITLGKHADQSNIINSNLEVIKTDRGGDVTYHGPGQLVGYPILRLADFHLTVKSYVNLIEQCLLELLESYSVAAHLDRDYPGVWIAQNKIAAIGINIARGVSTHGFALNVAVPVEDFAAIVPCGIKGRGVISLSCLSSRELNLEKVADELAVIVISRLERKIKY